MRHLEEDGGKDDQQGHPTQVLTFLNAITKNRLLNLSLATALNYFTSLKPGCHPLHDVEVLVLNLYDFLETNK